MEFELESVGFFAKVAILLLTTLGMLFILRGLNTLFDLMGAVTFPRLALPHITLPSVSFCLPGAWPLSNNSQDLDGPWDPSAKIKQLEKLVDEFSHEVVKKQQWIKHYWNLYEALVTRESAMSDWMRKATNGRFSGADSEDIPAFDATWLITARKTSPKATPPRLNILIGHKDAQDHDAAATTAKNQELVKEVAAAKNESEALRKQIEQLRAENLQARQQAKHQDCVIEQLRADNQQARQQLDEQRAQSQRQQGEATRELASEVERLQEQLGYAWEQCSKANNSSAAKDQQVAYLDAKLADYAAQARDYEALAVERVRSYEDAIAKMSTAEKELSANVAAANAEIAALHAAKAASEKAVQENTVTKAEFEKAVKKATKGLELKLMAKELEAANATNDRATSDKKLERANAQLNEYTSKAAMHEATEIRPLKLKIQDLERERAANEEKLAKAEKDKENALKGFEIKKNQFLAMQEENKGLRGQLRGAGLDV